MRWTAFKYIFVGALFLLVGWLLTASSSRFLENSQPATLIVLQVDERRDTDGKRSYRPVFGLQTTDRPRPEYAGSTWFSPKPHQPGDIVSGRYDPQSGEMRSDQMMGRSRWMWRVLQVVGALAVLQGILMFLVFQSCFYRFGCGAVVRPLPGLPAQPPADTGAMSRGPALARR
ncbi:DUF3592 domain-containing protein [Yoonia sp. R2-816]